MKKNILKEKDLKSLSDYEITTQNTSYTFEQLSNMAERGDIKIPDTQRDFIWNLQQCSKFIESILMRIPIPSIILYQNKEENDFLVVDGLQRLSSITSFLKGNKRLIMSQNKNKNNSKGWKLGKNVSKEISGKTFEELESKHRKTLFYSSINVITFTEEKPGDKTSLIEAFSRINNQGTPLNKQELRNAVYNGKFNDQLKEINQMSEWRKILNKKEPEKRMADVEILTSILAMYYLLEDKDVLKKSGSFNKTLILDNVYYYNNLSEYDFFEDLYKLKQSIKYFSKFDRPFNLYDQNKKKKKSKANKLLCDTIISLKMHGDIKLDEVFIKNLYLFQKKYPELFVKYFLEGTNIFSRISKKIEIIEKLSQNEWEWISKINTKP